MQSGRGGMGTSKHRKSGRTRANNITKHQVGRDVEHLHEKPKHEPEPMYDSVTEALRNKR